MSDENQLCLPTIEPPPFAPIWPKANTLHSTALQMFLEGKRLDHPSFNEMTGSWRLAAVVKTLKKLGWPIATSRIPAPSANSPQREIALYRLPASIASEALSMRGAQL